jgi:hypothetical protein
MFTEEPDQYLSGFRDFLLAQQCEKEDPALAALIVEIDRELSTREYGPERRDNRGREMN